LEAYLQNIGRSESKIVVYPQANHLLMLGETRGDLQLSEIEGYAPNLFMEIVNWIGERVGLKDKN
jgi:hypothetical protein